FAVVTPQLARTTDVASRATRCPSRRPAESHGEWWLAADLVRSVRARRSRQQHGLVLVRIELRARRTSPGGKSGSAHLRSTCIRPLSAQMLDQACMAQ